MRFQSKPITIEAECFREGEPLPFRDESACCFDGAVWYVVTTHGQKTLISFGDWIIREPNGNGFYPCKPDIFAKRYEPIQ